jgi:hypothetical protein
MECLQKVNILNQEICITHSLIDAFKSHEIFYNIDDIINKPCGLSNNSTDKCFGKSGYISCLNSYI